MGMRWTAWIVVIAALLAVAHDADARRRRRHRRRRSRHGSLELKSMTKGAEVYVDGELVGQVPLPKPVRLKTGKHTVKIIKRGYTQFLDVFVVKRGETTKLDIDLLPVAGVIHVSANVEKARVFIDGEFVGVTPVDKEVTAGKRTVRVTKVGHHDFIKSVHAVAGKEIPVEAKLKLLPVGSTPYRPPPPAPPEWYEHWYVWAGAAGGLVATTIAIVVPVVLANKAPFDPDNFDFNWKGR